MQHISGKPLIKWPGGKSLELSRFETMIPPCDRYIEPFVGGGALYFHLRPQRAVINDVSEGLMQFYRLAREGDAEFHRILGMYCRSFDSLKARCDERYPQLRSLFDLYRYARTAQVETDGLRLCRGIVEAVADDPEVIQELVTDRAAFLDQLTQSVEDKYLRTVRICLAKPFSEKDLKANLITGFTGGYYMYFRSVFNDIAARRMLCSEAYQAANFYFVREYCYGAMFRYNRDGEFNIPYGGISYNNKDFQSKVEYIFSEKTRALLQRTQLFCEDFETLLDRLVLSERDFLFLDPPYDTEFSDYEGKSFAREDHQRLAALLSRIPAKFLMVIKNTDYIYGLYEHSGFRILSFENRYMYNVRRRNERSAEHLIITNVPEEDVPWIPQNYEDNDL